MSKCPACLVSIISAYNHLSFLVKDTIRLALEHLCLFGGMQKFGLVVDVDGLVQQLDRDENGSIDYSEFKRLFGDEPPEAVDAY